MRIYFIIIFILVFFSTNCGDYSGVPEIDIYCNLPTQNDNPDIYIYDFPDSQTVGSTIVFAQTKVNTRVYWSSPDSFSVIENNISINNSIISGFTESDNQNGIAENTLTLSFQHIGNIVRVVGLVYGEDFSDDAFNSDTLKILINE